jgi:hypothetical protein
MTVTISHVQNSWSDADTGWQRDSSSFSITNPNNLIVFFGGTYHADRKQGYQWAKLDNSLSMTQLAAYNVGNYTPTQAGQLWTYQNASIGSHYVTAYGHSDRTEKFFMVLVCQGVIGIRSSSYGMRWQAAAGSISETHVNQLGDYPLQFLLTLYTADRYVNTLYSTTLDSRYYKSTCHMSSLSGHKKATTSNDNTGFDVVDTTASISAKIAVIPKPSHVRNQAIFIMG